MLKTNKVTAGIISFLICMIFLSSLVFANETQVVKIEPNIQYDIDSEVPNVTTDQMNDLIAKKGNQVVSIVQTFAVYISILVFVIGAILAVVGILGHGGVFTKGVITVLVSCVVFVLVQYAQYIMIYFKNFMIS